MPPTPSLDDLRELLKGCSPGERIRVLAALGQLGARLRLEDAAGLMAESSEPQMQSVQSAILESKQWRKFLRDLKDFKEMERNQKEN
jgi:hypothetical protein